MNRKITALAVAVTMGLTAVPAVAQNVNANNLVNVNVSNVANDLAKNLSVEVSDIPVTVQAPIGIAANVCDVSSNVLAEQADAPAECDASSTSTALNKIVKRQMGS